MRPLIVSFWHLNQRHSEGGMFPPGTCLGVGLFTVQLMRYLAARLICRTVALKSVGIEHAFYWYVTVMGAIAFLVSDAASQRARAATL